MSDTVLQITDKSGATFRIKISTPTSRFYPLRTAKYLKRLVTKGGWFGGELSGDWQTLDEGFIIHRSGKARWRLSDNGDLTTLDLLILGAKGIRAYDNQDLFGMQLFEYEDIVGPNAEGEGFVIQPWVINLTPGRISWKLVN